VLCQNGQHTQPEKNLSLLSMLSLTLLSRFVQGMAASNLLWKLSWVEAQAFRPADRANLKLRL
jgi:hypothetical protein